MDHSCPACLSSQAAQFRMQHFFKIWQRRISWLFQMLASGRICDLTIDFSLRCYRGFYHLLFHALLPLRREKQPPSAAPISVKTDFPVAYESPDHLVPWGTMNDNSSNKKFVLHMQTLIQQQQGRGPK